MPADNDDVLVSNEIERIRMEDQGISPASVTDVLNAKNVSSSSVSTFGMMSPVLHQRKLRLKSETQRQQQKKQSHQQPRMCIFFLNCGFDMCRCR